jgi:hypothetical protein
MKFIKKYFNTAPFVLPILGLFLWAMLLLEIANYWLDGVCYGLSYMLIPLWAMVYVIFWTACVYLKKWGMIGFVATTAISWLITLIFSESDFSKNTFSLWQTPIPINIVFSMVLLVFFKKFKFSADVLQEIDKK